MNKELTAEQRRRIRAAAEEFKRDMAKHGMTVEGVTRENGVPTIHVRLDHGEASKKRI